MKSDKLTNISIISIFIMTVLFFVFEKYKDNKLAVYEKTIEKQNDRIQKLNQSIIENEANQVDKSEIESLINENKALKLKINWNTKNLVKEEKKENLDFKKLSNDLKILKTPKGLLILPIKFEKTSSQVSIAYNERLKSISKKLSMKSGKFYEVEIEGYSLNDSLDPISKRKNIILAIERAYSVAMFLIAQGVLPQNIKIRGRLTNKIEESKWTEVFLKQR